MAISNAQLDADFAAIVEDWPLAVTFGIVTANGVRTSLRRADVLASEGLRDEYRFSVYISPADFTPLPTAGETVTIGGVVYRVLQTGEDPDTRNVRLDLGEEFASQLGRAVQRFL